MLIHDLHIRIINAATGELLRELTLDYQPTGPATRPKTKTTPNPMRVRGHFDVLRHHRARSEGLEPPTF
jgi:hypothetical protein